MLGRAGFGDVILGRSDLADLRASALQRTVHGGGRGTEQFGHLRGWPLQDFSEDQDGALLRRQVLQRGDEGEPDTVPRDSNRGRIRRLAGDHGVRDRLQPRHLRLLGQVGLRIGARGTEPAGQRAAVAALQRGQAGAGGDPVEPGPKRRALLEPVIGPPGAQVGLLHEILGVVYRAEHPVAMRQQLAPVRLRPWQELLLLDRAVRHRHDLSCPLPIQTRQRTRTHRSARELLAPRDQAVAASADAARPAVVGSAAVTSTASLGTMRTGRRAR